MATTGGVDHWLRTAARLTALITGIIIGAALIKVSWIESKGGGRDPLSANERQSRYEREAGPPLCVY